MRSQPNAAAAAVKRPRRRVRRCSAQVLDLYKACTHRDADARPTMKEIVQLLLADDEAPSAVQREVPASPASSPAPRSDLPVA